MLIWLLRYLPFFDLLSYRLRTLRRDLLASATVTFLDIPQGVAYAMIAGLPPAMGLYAAAVPAIVGALFRLHEHGLQVVADITPIPAGATCRLAGYVAAQEILRSAVKTA